MKGLAFFMPEQAAFVGFVYSYYITLLNLNKMSHITINTDGFLPIKYETYKQTCTRLRAYLGGSIIADDIFHKAVKANRDKWKEYAKLWQEVGKRITGITEGENEIQFSIKDLVEGDDEMEFSIKLHYHETADERASFDEPQAHKIKRYLEIHEASVWTGDEPKIIPLSDQTVEYLSRFINY